MNFKLNQKKQINVFCSKIITICCIILPIPVTKFLIFTFFSTNGTLMSYISIPLMIIAFILMFINQIIYVNFHFSFSLKLVPQNVLARLPQLNVYKQFGWIFITCFYQFSITFAYPNFFTAFLITTVIFSLYQLKKYALQLQYFQQRLNRNLGVLTILGITLNLSVLFCYLNISLFVNGLTTFFISFFLFFANFFITFKQFWRKKIIIDDHTTTQITQITYVITFIIFFSDISQRKNQTYISSLLKNHCNNCSQIKCCCKNRGSLYDPSQKINGHPNLQPHLDSVFIKHFYLKMINKSIVQFSKSLNLKLILALFYMQFLKLSSQCIKNIRFFNKKSIYDKLTWQQKHALFCMEAQFIYFVNQNNQESGNKKIEQIKQFDQHFNKLDRMIIQTTQNLRYFWEILNNLQDRDQDQQSKQISPRFLAIISNKTLKQMQQIQKLYEIMRVINPLSAQLRQLMFFYSKQVVADMDLFVQIKQNLKLQKVRTTEWLNQSRNILNLYGQTTASMVISGINKIEWVSNNARLVFGYKKNINLLQKNVNNLMPQFFSKNHDSLVKNWLQTGKCKKMNNASMIWCKKQNQTCFRAIIYMKVMPNFANPTQKDIQYYTSIENVGRNQVICGHDGQIYGCDFNLQSLMGCPIKVLQSFRPNIQVFFPILAPYFFPYFYNQNTQMKVKQQIQCSGYIPAKIVNFIENYKKQKQSFFRKNRKSKNLPGAYALFIQTKMSQITMQLNGKYLTVHAQIQKVNVLGREMIVMKIIKAQTDTIQRYYSQFESIIKILSQFKQKKQTKKQFLTYHKKVQHYSLSNPLQKFFNAKRLKKLANGIKIQQMQKSNSLNRRKQRAINQLTQIKNIKTRQTIFKIKNALYKNKIFSANTFKLLTEVREKEELKQIDVIKQQQQSQSYIAQASDLNLQKNKEKKKKRKNSFIFQQNHSDQQLMSSQDSLKQLKQIQQGNCKQTAVTFDESTTSSAIFISMSTKIKFLKKKLREVQPKILLIITSILFILTVISANAISIYTTINHITQIKYQSIQQLHLISTYRIIESLMTQKSLKSYTYKLYNNMNNTQYYQMTEKISNIFQYIAYQQILINTKQGQKYIQYSLPLNYLQVYLQNTDKQFEGNQIMLRDFILKQYKYLQKEIISICIKQYLQIINLISSQFQLLATNDNHYKIFYIFILFFIIKMLIFYNIYKSQIKIYQITKLISQLYVSDKQKYLKNFIKLTNKINSMLKMLNIIATKQQKYKKDGQQNRLSKQTFRILLNKQQKNNSRYDKKVLIWKIICIFSIIYIGIITFVVVQTIFTNTMRNKQKQLNQFILNKLNLTYKMLSLQSYIQNNTNSLSLSQLQNINITLPNKLINLYNSPQFSSQLTSNIQKYCIQNMCNKLETQKYNITDLCQQVNDGTFKQGIFNSFSYIDQSISYFLKNPSEYLQSQTNVSVLLHTFSINSLLTINLIDNFTTEKQKLHMSVFKINMILTIIFFCVSLAMIFIWKCVYFDIAKKGSLHNYYLLMLPFQVLMQNPYIKQYLKNQLKYQDNIY